MRNILALGMAVVLLLAIAVSMPVMANSEIHVYPGLSIQAAVDSASPGDIIIVHAGEYHQSVEISTNDITLQGEDGAILQGSGTPGESGIMLTGGPTGVTIEGFEIRGYAESGIFLATFSSGNFIINNRIASNYSGIFIIGHNNQVLGNKVINNGMGIGINGFANQVLGNKVINSTNQGIGISGASRFNVIQNNRIVANGVGIELDGTDANEILGNSVTGSSDTGISVLSSICNMIKENKVLGSGWMDMFDSSAPSPLENRWQDNVYGTANFIVTTPPTVPLLISPADGAIMDNGRTDGTDLIWWNFRWCGVEGATCHNLYVIGPEAEYPLIDVLTGSAYDYMCFGCYITEGNYYGWTWKVRAQIDGQWGEWSEIRTFDVEPVDTDL